ncbi:MAG TPA: PDZ domain-containing protein [Armatimonadota bacterium]|nr:PDZ domain-containing protein [Armatimonadota bacterium]
MYSGRVASVEPGSIAEEAGILPGDLIISINGHKLADIIDYRFYSTEEEIDVLVRRGDEEAVISIEKDYDDPLGIEFEDELFDGVRECGNRCIFCFVHQLPRGMRRSLYLRDDDYRLSFLHGNFVTLTNVTEDDLKRIIEQRLSPLYVSVYTTEPELRQQMIQSRCT